MQNEIVEPAVWPGATATAGTSVRGVITRRLSRLHERFGTLIRYALVGSVGYVVYVGLLTVMYDLALLPFLPAKGQEVNLLLFAHKDSLFLLTTLIASEASIVAVFAGHSLWTFTDSPASAKPLWLRFAQFEARALVSTLGILTVSVNVAVLAGLHHYLALPIGLVATFTWNWLWDSKVIWRKREQNGDSQQAA